MKVNLEQFMGLQLVSPTGGEELGKIKDLLFDDRSWNIRYITVDTGNWLHERKVIISPDHVRLDHWEMDTKHVETDLSREQIENSPSLDSDAPVSRRYEIEHARFYGQSPYWLDPGVWGMTTQATPIPPSPADVEEHEQALQEIEEKCHLYSCQEIRKYRVLDLNGESVGKLADFILTIPSWVITRLEIQEGNWFESRTAFLGTEAVESIEWEPSVIRLRTGTDQLVSVALEDAFA